MQRCTDGIIFIVTVINGDPEPLNSVSLSPDRHVFFKGGDYLSPVKAGDNARLHLLLAVTTIVVVRHVCVSRLDRNDCGLQ